MDRPIDAAELKHRLPQSALSFRGYNQTNLGRSAELLAHPRYGDIVAQYLREAQQVCKEFAGRDVDLIERVRKNQETTLHDYSEAISIILAMEQAQLHLLKEFFDIDYTRAKVSLGFSLGEVGAIVAGGLMSLRDALSVPMALSEDCIALAEGVKLAVLFSREKKVDTDQVHRLCMEITAEGNGTLSISTYLAPNSLLLMGQGDTIDRFRELMKRTLPQTYLRANQGAWPPLHTPIMWQRAIPNRSAVMMQTIDVKYEKPVPPILSLVTGKVSYDKLNARDLMHKWIDHPQRLWDAMYEALLMGIETFIHVGPEPNIIPATFTRLRDNVEAQSKANISIRALSLAAQRRWLQVMLPQRTALLRATMILQVNLEDWLLQQRF
ncbi:MAG: ACP S-malonyltransferase [Pirellulaceae bacterium]|nr:ACP S-malonyltransferase [Pirellulaceae bacterium]